MSRRSASSSPKPGGSSNRNSGRGGAGTGGGGGPPPSVPQDSDPNHRLFLLRSLDRCDTELVALCKINKSLDDYKNNIIENCGKQTLIHIGQGLITINNNDDKLMVVAPAQPNNNLQKQKQIVVTKSSNNDDDENDNNNDDNKENNNNDKEEVIVTLPDNTKYHEDIINFILHMKLRRKLCNRIVRRINRLSHAIDGVDVTPPIQPKYGDLKMNINTTTLSNYIKHWSLQKELKKHIDKYNKEKKQQEEDEKEELKLKKEEEEEAAAKEENVKEESKDDVNKEVVEQKMDGKDDDKMEIDTSTSAADNGDNEGAKDTKEGEQQEETNKASDNKEDDKGDNKDDDDDDAKFSKEAEYKAMVQEYNHSLKDYNDAYEKEITTTVGGPEQAHLPKSIKYTILDESYEDDYVSIKYGAGIGAVHRSMSSKEKEAECKRWQHSILSRIPDQVTYNDLGLSNNVFLLDERIKQIQKEEEEKAKEEEETQKINISSPSKIGGKVLRKPTTENDDDNEGEKMDLSDNKEKNVDDDVEMKDVDAKSPAKKSKSPQKGDNKSPEKTKEENKDENNEDDDEEEAEKKRIKLEELNKKRKRMSVAPVPSFYEQDMKRIRLIHFDMMSTEVQEHGRRSLSQATNAYNTCLRTSNNIYNQKNLVATNLNSTIYDNRLKLAKLKQEHAVEVAIAKARWQKRKDEWDLQKMRQLMPMNRGAPALGTIVTNQAIQRSVNDPILSTVATTLANIVDAVETLVESGGDNIGIEDFVPPQPYTSKVVNPSTGETYEQHLERNERSLRTRLANLNQTFSNAEEERKRSWKKLLKARSDFATDPSSGNRRGGRQQSDYNLMLPMPQLRTSTAAVAPLPASSSYSTSVAAATAKATTTSYSRAATASVPASLSSSYAATTTTTPTPAAAQVVPTSFKLQQSATSDAANRPSSQPPSESKYSVARVRERIKDDGTVRPVTMPKQNRDGTYQRPAGRTRKGMDWDAVRGVWVPQPNTNYH